MLSWNPVRAEVIIQGTSFPESTVVGPYKYLYSSGDLSKNSSPSYIHIYIPIRAYLAAFIGPSVTNHLWVLKSVDCLM